VNVNGENGASTATTAWNYFTHDQASSQAYRWGEDGLEGISDDKQRLCFALVLWQGPDPRPQREWIGKKPALRDR